MPIKKYDIDPAALDNNGIAENQTTAGAGNLTLNGAFCDLGTAGQFDVGDAFSSGIAGVQISFDSAGDISGVTFTITGLDENGNSVTEDVTGVTTTAVRTTGYWSKITQIAADGAVGSNVFIGTVSGDGLATKVIPLNKNSSEAATVAVAGLSGTIQYDLQETFDDLRLGSTSLNWVDIASNQSSNLTTSATLGATGVRLKTDTHADGAELQFYVSYNAYR